MRRPWAVRKGYKVRSSINSILPRETTSASKDVQERAELKMQVGTRNGQGTQALSWHTRSPPCLPPPPVPSSSFAPFAPFVVPCPFLLISHQFYSQAVELQRLVGAGSRYSHPPPARQICSCPSTWNRVAGLPRSGRFDCLTEPGIVHQAVAGLFAEKPCSYGATA
jgi:hypothetical protein